MVNDNHSKRESAIKDILYMLEHMSLENVKRVRWYTSIIREKETT